MSDDTGGKIGYYEAQAIRTIVREEIEKAVKKIIAAQHRVQADGGLCTCKKSIATTSTQNLCGNCGKTRRR